VGWAAMGQSLANKAARTKQTTWAGQAQTACLAWAGQLLELRCRAQVQKALVRAVLGTQHWRAMARLALLK